MLRKSVWTLICLSTGYLAFEASAFGQVGGNPGNQTGPLATPNAPNGTTVPTPGSQTVPASIDQSIQTYFLANTWRYRFHDGRWWYWLPTNRWVVFANGRWIDSTLAQTYGAAGTAGYNEPFNAYADGTSYSAWTGVPNNPYSVGANGSPIGPSGWGAAASPNANLNGAGLGNSGTYGSGYRGYGPMGNDPNGAITASPRAGNQLGAPNPNNLSTPGPGGANGSNSNGSNHPGGFNQADVNRFQRGLDTPGAGSSSNGSGSGSGAGAATAGGRGATGAGSTGSSGAAPGAGSAGSGGAGRGGGAGGAVGAAGGAGGSAGAGSGGGAGGAGGAGS